LYNGYRQKPYSYPGGHEPSADISPGEDQMTDIPQAERTIKRRYLMMCGLIANMIGNHRFFNTLLALCIVLCVFAASAVLVFSLAPKPEKHPIDIKEIRKIGERVHRKNGNNINPSAAHRRILDAAS
jgi:hypothetical protein